MRSLKEGSVDCISFARQIGDNYKAVCNYPLLKS